VQTPSTAPITIHLYTVVYLILFDGVILEINALGVKTRAALSALYTDGSECSRRPLSSPRTAMKWGQLFPTVSKLPEWPEIIERSLRNFPAAGWRSAEIIR